MSRITEIPVSDVDLFSDKERVDLYPVYDRLREGGPVVHLTRTDLYAPSTPTSGSCCGPTAR